MDEQGWFDHLERVLHTLKQTVPLTNKDLLRPVAAGSYCVVCERLIVLPTAVPGEEGALCSDCWAYARTVLDVSGLPDPGHLNAATDDPLKLRLHFRAEGVLRFAVTARRFGLHLQRPPSERMADLTAVALVKRLCGGADRVSQGGLLHWARLGLGCAGGCSVHQLTPRMIELVCKTRVDCALGGPPHALLARPLLLEIAGDSSARLARDSSFLGAYRSDGCVYLVAFDGISRPFVVRISPSWNLAFEDMLAALRAPSDVEADDVLGVARFILTFSLLLETACLPVRMVLDRVVMSKRPDGTASNDDFAAVRYCDFDPQWRDDEGATSTVPAGTIRDVGVADIPVYYWSQDDYALRDAARDLARADAGVDAFRLERRRSKPNPATTHQLVGVLDRLKRALPLLQQEHRPDVPITSSQTISEAQRSLGKWLQLQPAMVNVLRSRVRKRQD